MIRAHLAVSFLFLSACFQTDDTLVLRADGSASLTQWTRITDNFWAAMQEIAALEGEPSPVEDVRAKVPTKKQAKKALKGTGIALKEHELQLDAQRWVSSWGVDVQHLASLDRIGVLFDRSAAPPTEPLATLTDLGDGTVRLTWRRPPAPDAAPQLAQPDPNKPRTPEQEEKAMALLFQAMTDSANMRIATALEVPGTIVSADPSWGTVEGSKVSWVITADSATKGEAFDPNLPYSVVFKPAEPLPAAAFR